MTTSTERARGRLFDLRGRAGLASTKPAERQRLENMADRHEYRLTRPPRTNFGVSSLKVRQMRDNRG